MRCLRLKSRGVHQTQIWVALRKGWEPLIQPFLPKRLKSFFNPLPYKQMTIGW